MKKLSRFVIYYNPIIKAVSNIIDEWLLLKPTENEQHDILELLHHRRKKSSTIFCSQYEFNGWFDQLGGDDSPLAEAILDRIKYDAYKINIVPVDEYSDTIVHLFRKFRAPFSGKIVHAFPEKSAGNS